MPFLMKIEIPEKRTRGRPWRWWNDNIKENIYKEDRCQGRGNRGLGEIENGDVLLQPLGRKAEKKKKNCSTYIYNHIYIYS